MANINISIPDTVHKNLKVAAVMQQRSLKDLIIEMLNEYASASTKQKKSVSVSRTQKNSFSRVKK